MGQMTVFSGVERRRRWSDEARLEILSEAFAPGAKVIQVARHHDVSTGQIYTWRRQFDVAEKLQVQDVHGPDFAEAVLADGSEAARVIGRAKILEKWALKIP